LEQLAPPPLEKFIATDKALQMVKLVVVVALAMMHGKVISAKIISTSVLLAQTTAKIIMTV